MTEHDEQAPRPRDHDEAAELMLRARVKEQLRSRMRGVRRVMGDEARAARSAVLCARVLELPEVQSARTVIGYQAFRKEPDLSGVLTAVAARGARIGLPRMIEQHALELHEHDGTRDLVENAWGICEPDASAPRIELDAVDVVLVPALALDVRGYRLGYGKGFYDRLLPQLPRACAVGVIYDFELLGELPDMPHDVALSIVVTDARTVRVSAG